MAATKYTKAQVDAFEARSHAQRLAKLKGQKAAPADPRSNLILKRLKHTKSKGK